MNKQTQTNSNNDLHTCHDIRILIVDDDDLVRKTVNQILQKKGYSTIMAHDGESAINAVKKNFVEIALLDYNLPDTDGIQLISQIKEISSSTICIIITGYGTIERAVEAMHSGAWDFITKPVTAGMLFKKIERIQEYCFLKKEQDFRTKAVNKDFEYSGVVGPSNAMRPVYESILRASESSLPVLIEGETGSGKEFVAESIHLNSKRKNKPFIILDCTATPDSLIEATLFGSSKGAFTGAVERKGLLDAANGEIAADIQPKLLRCLETKRFRPVGSTKECSSDFRIICATNRDLLSETKAGKFRQDLYYRVSALRIQVPCLREHASDIQAISQHFLHEIAQQEGRKECVLPPDVIALLQKYDWPGNIRQLKFVIENAFFNAKDDQITVKDIDLEGFTTPAPCMEDQKLEIIGQDIDFKTFREEAVSQAEKNYIAMLLDRTGGDVRIAAKQAGLTREALYRIMSRCGLSPNDYRQK